MFSCLIGKMLCINKCDVQFGPPLLYDGRNQMLCHLSGQSLIQTRSSYVCSRLIAKSCISTLYYIRMHLMVFYVETLDVMATCFWFWLIFLRIYTDNVRWLLGFLLRGNWTWKTQFSNVLIENERGMVMELQNMLLDRTKMITMTEGQANGLQSTDPFEVQGYKLRTLPCLVRIWILAVWKPALDRFKKHFALTWWIDQKVHKRSTRML